VPPLDPESVVDAIDDRVIERIAERVVVALREDLELLAAQFAKPEADSEQLTVSQIARQLGVAPSTVYAHWREWGGYTLGSGEKAPIRFDPNALPIAARKSARQRPAAATAVTTGAGRPHRRRQRRDLLQDAPRVLPSASEVA
jgi:transposase-like protein